LDAQLVAGAHGTRPAELVEARAEDAARGLHLALDDEPHGDRRGVPAARGEPLEERIVRGGFVEVIGLRIVLRGEGLDRFRIDAQAPGREFLAGREIFEIAFHADSLPAAFILALDPRSLPAYASAEDDASVDAALHAHLAVGVAFAETIAQALQLGRDLLRDGRCDHGSFFRSRRAARHGEQHRAD